VIQEIIKQWAILVQNQREQNLIRILSVELKQKDVYRHTCSYCTHKVSRSFLQLKCAVAIEHREYRNGSTLRFLAGRNRVYSTDEIREYWFLLRAMVVVLCCSGLQWEGKEQKDVLTYFKSRHPIQEASECADVNRYEGCLFECHFRLDVCWCSRRWGVCLASWEKEHRKYSIKMIYIKLTPWSRIPTQKLIVAR
jgi:hypothetical protein